MADDDIVRLQFDGIAGDAHAVARGCVAGDRDVGGAHAQVVFEADDAGDIENDDARAGRFTGGPKAPGAGVVEIGNDNDFAAAAAKGIHAATPGAGKAGILAWGRSSGLAAPGR